MPIGRKKCLLNENVHIGRKDAYCMKKCLLTGNVPIN